MSCTSINAADRGLDDRECNRYRRNTSAECSLIAASFLLRDEKAFAQALVDSHATVEPSGASWLMEAIRSGFSRIEPPSH
jgi:hypothetical protein